MHVVLLLLHKLVSPSLFTLIMEIPIELEEYLGTGCHDENLNFIGSHVDKLSMHLTAKFNPLPWFVLWEAISATFDVQ